MTKISVVHGSLTDGPELVLVNASNTNCDLGSGVSGALRRACGAGYQEWIHRELVRLRGGPIEPGEVIVTDAGSHPIARFVAHVAVMDYRHAWDATTPPDEARIERGCQALWPAIEAIGDDLTVAMVALGAGTGGLGVRIPTEIACRTLTTHLARGSRIAGVTFYGWQSFEALAIADVVTTAFPDATSGLPADLREALARMRKERP